MNSYTVQLKVKAKILEQNKHIWKKDIDYEKQWH